MCERSKRLAAAACIALLAAGAQTRPEPIQWSIKPARALRPLHPGDRFTVRLTAAIANGWHLYSTEQEPGGPIATRIVLPAAQAFQLAGKIEEPGPLIQFDASFNMDTQFFEDEAMFTIPLRVAANATAGKQRAKVNVTFQTCNGKQCLPPKTVPLAAEVEISARPLHATPRV